MNDEVAMILYDLGFAAVHAEMTELAYDYWNQLYQIDRGTFRNVQHLHHAAPEGNGCSREDGGREEEGSVMDFADDWLRDAFPPNYLMEYLRPQGGEAGGPGRRSWRRRGPTRRVTTGSSG